MDARAWIQAARPKTLGVSIAPVLVGSAMAWQTGHLAWPQAWICLGFAILAQITSNLVNDYADGKAGSDAQDERLGPERMVASGRISARAMGLAAVGTMGVALGLGCSLIYWGGWWLVAVGAAVAVGAFAYSCGRWSLSRLGLGDGAVVLFYGIVPVAFTFYVQAGTFSPEVWGIALGMGLVGDQLLIVNNYRDAEQDAACGKRTTVVRFGRRCMRSVYAGNAILAIGLGFWVFRTTPWIWAAAIVPFGVLTVCLTIALGRLRGRDLNQLLGKTSLNGLIYALAVVVTSGLAG